MNFEFRLLSYIKMINLPSIFILLLWVQFKGKGHFHSEEVACFPLLCCPGWAGQDLSSSIQLRRILMPAQEREDHSPLTFSERRDKNRRKESELRQQTVKAECVCVCVCVCVCARACVWVSECEREKGILRQSKTRDRACRLLHKQIFSLWCGWICYLLTCWADGWGGVCVCACPCVRARVHVCVCARVLEPGKEGGGWLADASSVSACLSLQTDLQTSEKFLNGRYLSFLPSATEHVTSVIQNHHFWA